MKIVGIEMRVVYLSWRQSTLWSPMRYKIFQTYWYIGGLLISLGWIRDPWPVVFHNSEFHTPTGISRTTGTVQGYESWTFENNLPWLPQKKLILVVYNGGFWEVNDCHLIKFAWSESFSNLDEPPYQQWLAHKISKSFQNIIISKIRQ